MSNTVKSYSNYYQFKSPFTRVVYYTFYINHTSTGILSTSSVKWSNAIELRRVIYEFISHGKQGKLVYCSEVPSVDNEITIGVAIPFFSDADEIGYSIIDNVKLEKNNVQSVTLSLLNIRDKL